MFFFFNLEWFYQWEEIIQDVRMRFSAGTLNSYKRVWQRTAGVVEKSLLKTRVMNVWTGLREQISDGRHQAIMRRDIVSLPKTWKGKRVSSTWRDCTSVQGVSNRLLFPLGLLPLTALQSSREREEKINTLTSFSSCLPSARPPTNWTHPQPLGKG